MPRLLNFVLTAVLVGSSVVVTAPMSATATAETTPDQPVETVLEHEHIGLPDFDIREQYEIGGLSKAFVLDDAIASARHEAVAQFRSQLAPAMQEGLHFELGRTGAARTFFNYDGTLTTARVGTADAIAREFLVEQREIVGLSKREVATLKVEMNHEFEGTTFLEYSQTLKGVPVYGSNIKVIISPLGEVRHVSTDRVVPGAIIKVNPALAEETAISTAFEHAGVENVEGFVPVTARKAIGDVARYENPLGENREEITSALRVIEINGEARLAYEVTVDVGSSEWYSVILDASTGELLVRRNLYSCAQGLVYKESPRPMGVSVNQTTEQFVPMFGINAADVWLSASATTSVGNNVDAYLDRDANNSPDNTNTTGISGGRAYSTSQNFSWTYTQGVDPRTQPAPVVTNLFYLCNYMHDWMYSLGFTESARNFQTNNYGRGGAGNDPVKAEAQDGSGTNNANFATPADGSSGRMQQYLFTMSTSSLADDRDSSVDGDVVLHEYGHGVSNRLIGNGSGLSNHQGRSMGEGWSDYWACTNYNNGVMGDYVTNNTSAGIRRAGYAYPANAVHDSFSDLGGTSVHGDGEIWCATLWDLRTQLGKTITDRLVLEGMKYTATSPSFPHARDGILQADQALNGGANKCTIWTVFARHGMGASAGYANGTSEQPATNLPTECGGGGGGGSTILSCGAEDGTTTGWTTTSNISGNNWVVDSTSPYAGTKRFRSSNAANYVNNLDQSLLSPVFSLAGKTSATLKYQFKHSTESGYDYFRVEISTNGGSSWTTLTSVSGNSSGWSAWAPQASISLNSYVGSSNCKIRFRLTSDTSVTGWGAAVDDIVVTGS